VKVAIKNFGLAPQLVALLLVLGLVGAMAIQPTRQLLEQRRRIAAMAGELDRLQESNDELELRIARLKDPDYIEQQARALSGLVRPGERTFVVMPSRKKERNRRPQETDSSPTTPEPGFVEGFLGFIGIS
jgi:cell division protein FtsB